MSPNLPLTGATNAGEDTNGTVSPLSLPAPASERYLAEALDAAWRGFGVLPKAMGEKRPIGPYKHKPALRGEAEIRRGTWQYGVCIMLDGRHYVLDADRPESVPIVESFDTLRVKTARGMHAYFRLPSGLHLRQGRAIVPGVDGKGISADHNHTVVIWAGEDGRQVCHDVEPAELPAQWAHKIGVAGTGGSAGRPLLSTPERVRCANKRLAATAAQTDIGVQRYAAVRVELLADLRAPASARSWGDHFYYAASQMGEAVAAGWVGYDEVRDALWQVFEQEDRDPRGDWRNNVRRSINNGLTSAVREAWSMWAL